MSPEPFEGKITCLIADDHPAVLEAVAEFLVEGGIEVVGRAATARRRWRRSSGCGPASRSSTCGCRSSAESS